ncbi:MAG: hypothetical protein QNJ72_03230 [Pleurocapsa sp. MO_226.B13]|nr:hypothetical protein [Pleurocapsa sp. MO_226.B13]
MKNKILLWLAIALVVVIIWLLIPNIWWQYIFFLRIPLLMTVLLLAMPAIAELLLPAMLKNLFVLRGIWQMAFTILAATVAGLAVIFVGDWVAFPRTLNSLRFKNYLMVLIYLGLILTVNQRKKGQLEFKSE